LFLHDAGALRKQKTFGFKTTQIPRARGEGEEAPPEVDAAARLVRNRKHQNIVDRFVTLPGAVVLPGGFMDVERPKHLGENSFANPQLPPPTTCRSTFTTSRDSALYGTRRRLYHGTEKPPVVQHQGVASIIHTSMLWYRYIEARWHKTCSWKPLAH